MKAIYYTTILFPILYSLTLLTSCSNSSQIDNNRISAAELAFKNEANDSTANLLISELQRKIDDTDNLTIKITLNNKIASTQLTVGLTKQAVQSYVNILKNHADNPAAFNSALNLGNIYLAKLNNPNLANAVFSSMNDYYKGNERLKEIPSINLKKEWTLVDRLDELGAKIYNEQTNKINLPIAQEFIGIAEIMGCFYPNNAKTPRYLHDAGRTAGYSKDNEKALYMYQWVVDNYPNDEQAINSTFMIGYTYDNDFEDYGKAKMYYEEFLSKYPNDDLAPSAKMLLNHLGVPDDQIIESLKKKGQ